MPARRPARAGRLRQPARRRGSAGRAGHRRRRLKAARDRLALAARSVSRDGAIALNAPDDALLRAVHAAPGQTVAAGAPLFDLVRLDTVWIRVPVFAGESADVDRGASARIVPLGAIAARRRIAAQPVAAPPSADAATAAVDLYFAVANAGRRFRPGSASACGCRSRRQRAASSCRAPRCSTTRTAAPGSTRRATPHVFVRRRVSVRTWSMRLAVLDQGPPPGTKVVTAGAAELFGTEFGVGK